MERWTENDSKRFLTFVDVITPSRLEQMTMLANLIPAAPEEPFTFVELGCGGGDLAALILERFPHASYVGLDGSEVMLETAARRLVPYRERISLQPFRLEEADVWLHQLPAPVRCFVSSLVIHHLHHPEKRELYQRLYDHLAPGGALLLIDIVQPNFKMGAEALGANWDAVVQAQSQAITGSLDTYRQFKAEGWNCYSHPDPMDRPAPLFTQLTWLAEIGYKDVDCFWQRGGHAVYGGYKR